MSGYGGARASRRAGLCIAAFGVALTIATAPRVGAQNQDGSPAPSAAPEGAGPDFGRVSNEEQLDLLRKLLGVEAPEPPSPESPSPEPPSPAARPAVVRTPEPPIKAKPAPQPKVEEQPTPVRVPAVRPEPAPQAAPAVDKKPAPRTAPRPEVEPAPKTPPTLQAKPKAKPTPRPAVGAPKPAPRRQPEAPIEAAAEPPIEAPIEEAAAKPRFDPSLQITATDLPDAGTVITAANVDRWQHLLTPSLRWSVRRGVPMEVVDPKPIVMEPERADATERYHAQVELSPDKKRLLNYVAGVPFPYVDLDDPDAALKLMFNFENRVMFDDVDGRNFACKTGALDVNTGVRVERDYRVGHFRRLFYTGRLRVDPKPTIETPDEIRYREAIFPIIEPFDFKGAGFTYNRYLEPGRMDDAWLYFPQVKRVRRLSTAQRSEGVFGIDVDLDSYAGFAGNPAWFDWELLGKKTILAPFHAKHEPIKWADKPADFMFDDIWEPREMYIISARSLIPGYNFSLRVIYLDVQSLLIPYTEVYDHQGQLWRAYVQQWKTGLRRPMPYAKTAVYDVPTNFIAGLTVFDMQQEHATFCEFPASDFAGEEMWFYWQGENGGSVEDDFDVQAMISAGR